MMRHAWLVVLVLLARSVSPQLNVAHTDDAVDALHKGNKFFERVAPADAPATTGFNASDGQKCVHDMQLAWSAKLGSSLYSVPTVASTAYGPPTVLASTFVRYIEAVRGADGHEVAGWPYTFSRSSFHSSPLLLDVDRDGVDEVLLVTFEAELHVLGADGLPRRGMSTRLPKLRVRKRWFEGLHDVHTTPREHKRLVEHDDQPPDAEAEGGDGREEVLPSAGGFASDDVGAHGALSPEAEASFGLFALDEGDDDALAGGEEYDETAGPADGEEPRLARWVELYEDADELRRLDGEGQVLVDAHVLTTPVLADVDGDGEVELVLAVSYFIEEESAARLARHGVLLDRTR